MTDFETGSLADLVNRDKETGDFTARVAFRLKGTTYNKGSYVSAQDLFGDKQQMDLWESLYSWDVEGTMNDELIFVRRIYREGFG